MGYPARPPNTASSNGYHLTATIGGKAQTFNQNTVGTLVALGGVYQFAIEGFAVNGSSTPALSVGWTNTSAGPIFGKGTWTDTSTRYSVAGIYLPSATEQYICGTNFFETVGAGVTLNHLKIIITGFDSSTIRGTFSGDFFAGGMVSGTKITITDGDFYVPRK